jgi:hypothetical protein
MFYQAQYNPQVQPDTSGIASALTSLGTAFHQGQEQHDKDLQGDEANQVLAFQAIRSGQLQPEDLGLKNDPVTGQPPSVAEMIAKYQGMSRNQQKGLAATVVANQYGEYKKQQLQNKEIAAHTTQMIAEAAKAGRPMGTPSPQDIAAAKAANYQYFRNPTTGAYELKPITPTPASGRTTAEISQMFQNVKEPPISFLDSTKHQGVALRNGKWVQVPEAEATHIRIGSSGSPYPNAMFHRYQEAAQQLGGIPVGGGRRGGPRVIPQTRTGTTSASQQGGGWGGVADVSGAAPATSTATAPTTNIYGQPVVDANGQPLNPTAPANSTGAGAGAGFPPAGTSRTVGGNTFVSDGVGWVQQ